MIYEGQSFDTPQEALAHYGAKGMKWGVRKDQESSSAGSKTQDAQKLKSSAGGSVASIAKARGKFVEDWGDPLAPKVATASRSLKKAEKLEQKAEQLSGDINSIKTEGLQSKAITNVYGKKIAERGDKLSDLQFKLLYGQSKEGLLSSQISIRQKEHDKLKADASVKREGKLTHDEKVQIGAAVAVAGLLAYGGYNLYRNTKFYPPGGEISLSAFMTKTGQSQYRNWMGDTSISKNVFNSMSNSDVHVPSGSILQRISTFNKTSLDDYAYATHTAEDANRYRAVFTRELAGSRQAKEFYSIGIKAESDLLGPSPKKRVQLFGEMLEQDETNKSLLANLVRANTPLYHPETSGNSSSHDLALRFYNTMAANQGTKDELSTRYFEFLKSKGYNFLTDDMDAGIIGDSPGIILNKSAVKHIQTTALSKADIKLAGKNLVELKNRR